MVSASLTQEQQALRLTGIGASEIAAVAGLDPYRRPIDIYAVKRRLVEPFEGNRFTKWGSRIEPAIAEAYAEEQGVVLTQPGTMRHPQHEWMLATPDRLVHPADFTPPVRGLEIKTAGMRQSDYWGTASDDVPEKYLVQCAWSMAVTGLPEWDLAVLIGGNDDRFYRLHRDLELEAGLIEVGRRFWFDHVLAEVAPPVDGSVPYSKFLAARFPRDERPLLPTTTAARDLLDLLRDARSRLAVVEEEAAKHENELKALIGDAAGIEGVATWKATRPITKTDWEAVAREAAAPQALIAKHTTQKPGYRRFLPNLKEQ